MTDAVSVWVLALRRSGRFFAARMPRTCFEELFFARFLGGARRVMQVATFTTWFIVTGIAATTFGQVGQFNQLGDSDAFGRRGPGFFVIPAFRVSQIHDDNLFFVGDDPVASSYTLYTPSMQLLYDGERFVAATSVSLQAQAFPSEQAALTQPSARRGVEFLVSYRSSERNTVSAQGSYRSTYWPGELIEDTGIELKRARSDGYSASFNFSRRFSVRHTIGVNYRFRYTNLGQDDEIALGLRTSSHLVDVTSRYRLSSRNEATFSYSFSSYSDDQLSSALNRREGSQGQALTVSLRRTLSRQLTASIRGGPRLNSRLVTAPSGEPELETRNFLTADVRAELEYARRGTRVAAAYRRSQVPAFGLNGSANSDSVDTRIDQRFGQKYNLSVQARAYRNRLDAVSLVSYRASASAGVRVKTWFLVSFDYRYSQQEGFSLLGAAPASELRPVTRNLFAGSVTLGYPLRVN